MPQGHVARKRFGQNFLIDVDVIQRIVSSVAPKPGQSVVEIGPGLGALTDRLLRACGKLDVVEIDRDLIARLRERYTPEQMTLHEGDALAFDFSTLLRTNNDKLRVVGNLPYNISTPLLFHLAGYAKCIQDMTFMLQKEVVDRMVALAGHADYGRLSVMLQYRFDMAQLFDVPPDAFRPAPKVVSSIVYMRPKQADACTCSDEHLLGKIVAAAFGQRRKTLRNTLREYIQEAGFDTLGIDPGLRGEVLSVSQYVAIANFCATGAVVDDDKLNAVK